MRENSLAVRIRGQINAILSHVRAFWVWLGPTRALLLHPDELYAARQFPGTWLYMLGISVVLGWFVREHGPAFLGVRDVAAMLQSFGGTALLAVSASPLIWYLWLVRDYTKREDQRHAASAAAREHFNKRREWATGTDETRRIAALYELQNYLHEDLIRRLLPRIISSEESYYKEVTRTFFCEMLRNRTLWDEPYRRRKEMPGEEERVLGIIMEPDSEGYVSPMGIGPHFHAIAPSGTRNAMSAIIRKSAAQICDFRGAQLGYMRLYELDAEGVDFTGAEMVAVELTHGNLKGAKFRHANLMCAFIVDSDFQGADFRAANLKYANEGLSINGPNLRGADLRGADMTHLFVREAALSGAKIDQHTTLDENLLKYLLVHGEPSSQLIEAFRTESTGANCISSSQ